MYLCDVIITDHSRVRLWLHFLRVILEMSPLTLLVQDALALVFPVIIRPVLVVERCVCMCVRVCAFVCVYSMLMVWLMAASLSLTA